MSAWKACDIRGSYPGEVNEDLISSVAAHIVSMLPPSPRILSAGDFRESTPNLKRRMDETLVQTGAQVMDAGQVPTPVAYYGHQYFGTDAVLIITASHNPPGDNGLKVMIGAVPPSEEDWARLRKAVQNPAPQKPGGARRTVDLPPRYATWITDRWQRLKLLPKPFVVIDAGGGAWSEIAPRIFENLGFKTDRLFCEIDGKFRFRNPDCARVANLEPLRQRVLEVKADLGIAWDGDGDRVAFVDGTGAFISPDQISIILTRFLLRNRPNEKVVYDVKLSFQLAKAVRDAGGVALLERSGHAFLKRRMIEGHCIVGCEASGHYFYRELRGGDDGLFTALLFTEAIATDGSARSLISNVPAIYATPDLRMPNSIVSYALAESRLRARFPEAEQVRVDGCRFDLPCGTVLIRQSVTEPAITMRIEGISREALSQLISECKVAIPEVAALLQVNTDKEIANVGPTEE